MRRKSREAEGGYRHDQMPSNGTRDPDRHRSGSRKLSMQCGVLRAHPLRNLPDQSRLVRQGSLGLRAELDSGDDVLAHGKRKTGANMNGRIWRTRPMSRIRCADGADEMNFRAVELRSVIIQSLRNTQTARKELLPLTTNLSTAAACFQIKLCEFF
jgi:hypothetical protein